MKKVFFLSLLFVLTVFGTTFAQRASHGRENVPVQYRNGQGHKVRSAYNREHNRDAYRHQDAHHNGYKQGKGHKGGHRAEPCGKHPGQRGHAQGKYNKQGQKRQAPRGQTRKGGRY